MSHIMKAALVLANVVAGLIRLTTGSQLPGARTHVACGHPTYGVHVVSSDPLVLYIRNFLTDNERRHLLRARCVSSVREPKRSAHPSIVTVKADLDTRPSPTARVEQGGHHSQPT